MLFHVEHETIYRYSRRVSLEPHVVRLRPRCDATQRLHRFELHIEPRPLGRTDCVDLDGTATTYAWFGPQTETLEVHTAFTAETLRGNPFDFIVTEPMALKLPMQFGNDRAQILSPYRTRVQRSGAVDRFVESIVAQAGHETVPFLTALNAAVHHRTRTVIRETGDPFPPERTLAERSGSCRDVTVLFMDACRAVGIPARFVSGYWHAETEREKRHMHAWVEVYLPGGGWRGFDPSKGLAVADEHVAVAAAVFPANACPVAGTFRGTGVESTMEASVHIRCE